MNTKMLKGHPLGFHRVLDEPKVLPQNALRLDPTGNLYSNELAIDVEYLQIDAASFQQLKSFCKTESDMKSHILDIVSTRGKMQNPVTGSGGMLLGKVSFIGVDYPKSDVRCGDAVATLVSLTATPLEINRITGVDFERERIAVEGRAILFERSLFAKMPTDMSQGAALAVFDICGAAPLVLRHASPGDCVFVMGLGKAGKCVVSALRQRLRDQIKIIGIDGHETSVEFCNKNYSSTGDDFAVINAQDTVHVMNWVEKKTNGKMSDLSVNLVNVPNTEMSAVLATRNRGKCIFFSMATDFQKASLGTEAVGLDLDLLMGAGFVEAHADDMMDLVRADENLKNYFERHFGS